MRVAVIEDDPEIMEVVSVAFETAWPGSQVLYPRHAPHHLLELNGHDGADEQGRHNARGLHNRQGKLHARQSSGRDDGDVQGDGKRTLTTTYTWMSGSFSRHLNHTVCTLNIPDLRQVYCI